MIIIYTTSLFVCVILAIGLYCQNRYLIKNLKNEKETENSKQTFIATLVHDLKTPTNAQINSLNLLRNGTFGKLNSEQKEIITLTQESCKYMSNLIGTIMETYKNDLGKTPLKIDEFNVIELINKVCDGLKSLYESKELNVNFIMGSDEILLYADKLQLERVIFNLMSNAITYSFYGTTIEIITKITPNSFEFCINNISEVIPEAELATIFDKFQQAGYAIKNNTGTGLGLYLAKQIIESHNGRIYARSLPDGTCSFGFIVPNKVKLMSKKCQLNT